jgi:hypothetical protein
MTISIEVLVALKRTVGVVGFFSLDLLGAGVFCDGLGALGDSVLGQFTGKEKTDSSLDLPGSDGGPLVVVGQARCFGSNALKNVVDKRVHDAHGLGGDTGVRVDLFQHLVDVDGVRFLSLLLPSLAVSRTSSLSLTGFLRALG